MHLLLVRSLYLFLRLYCFEDFLHKTRLWVGTYHFNTVVHHGFGYTLHLVALCQVDELGDFDHIGGDMFVFDCQLVGQPGRTRTIGSGRGDEYLNVDILIDGCQGFAGFVAQIGGPFGDIDEVFNQRGEFVACRDTEVAHRAFRVSLEDERRNVRNAEVLCLLLIADEILDGQVQFVRDIRHFLEQFAGLLAIGAFLAWND